jgi:hypothetical protein
MQERENERGDIPVDIEGRLSDEDFADGIRILLYQNLTNTLRSLMQDPRFVKGCVALGLRRTSTILQIPSHLTRLITSWELEPLE